jgi:hypothetical protein
MLARMTTKKPTATATIEVTSKSKTALETKARRSGKTVADIVEALLAREEELDDEEDLADDDAQAEYEAGVADIEENGGVEHERVVDWLRSLGTEKPLPLPTPNPRLK